jgi:hypothetical protein
MASPFAAIEERVNQSLVNKLSNADADFGGGLVVSGIFDKAPELNFDVQSSSPQFECLESSVSSISIRAAVIINDVNYTVKSIEPDGVGMVLIQLLEA